MNLPYSVLIGILSLIFSYLFGSIPTGYIAGKLISGIDLRELGSGSTGATNVLRHVGKRAALVVFILDISKGILPVLYLRYLALGDHWQVIAGLAAVIGHIWPVWLKGKGGKAVATGLGVLLGLSWPVGIASLGVFLSIFSVSKIVSLASSITALLLPLLMFLSFESNTFILPYFLASLAMMAFVLWRHRTNIHRLIKGTEPKIGQ
tara:strand:- start:309 stop:926 length:618 start_codon:yes stop_codon:yes gene_type:complete